MHVDAAAWDLDKESVIYYILMSVLLVGGKNELERYIHVFS